jgi:DNA replication protein DnaC
MAQPDCPQCGGSGWKTVERVAADEDARRVAVQRTARAGGASAGGGAAAAPATAAVSVTAGPSKLVWAVPCDCAGNDRTTRAIARTRLPKRYEHCDFSNFDTDLYDTEPGAEAWNRSLKQTRIVMEAFAREFPAGSQSGILLMGPCGVGKTHLAVAALRALVLRGHQALFYDYRELLKEIQASYNAVSQTTEMSVLEPVLTAEVLLLDDIGASKPSAWALETVGHILNTRYNERRVTLLTTNYLDIPGPAAIATAGRSASSSRSSANSGSTFGVAPAQQEDSLTDRLSMRIRSRLYEMCRTVEVAAPDYRREIRQAGRVRS